MGTDSSANGFDVSGADPKSGKAEGKSKDDLIALSGSLSSEHSGVAAKINSLIENFASADSDSDGSISDSEFRKYIHPKKTDKSEKDEASEKSADSTSLSISKFAEAALRRYGGVGGSLAAKLISAA